MGHGPLVLVRKLGAGALGSVYLAEHPSSGAHFAVKVLHPHLASNPAVLGRFYAEARAAQHIIHPSVARVLDVRQAPSGHHCLLMEYVNGTALSHLPLPLPSAEVVFLLSQVLEGLEAAHACGAVHRDIKPENLILTTGRDGERRVKLLDFGMSATLAAGFSEEELAAGMVVGSPGYLAPELWVRAEPDGRADLYALAVLGYRLLTGRLPFGGGGRMGEMLLVHKPTKPLPPHILESRVPQALSAVLMQAMSLRPDERFATARAFRSALHEAMRRPAFGCLAPPAFHVRVEDPEGKGLQPVFVNDVSQEGLRIACDGTLPRLGARIEVELSLNGWSLACTCDVVRLLPAEEARTWGGRQGYILHFSEPSDDVRRLIAQALAPPPAEPLPDTELRPAPVARRRVQPGSVHPAGRPPARGLRGGDAARGPGRAPAGALLAAAPAGRAASGPRGPPGEGGHRPEDPRGAPGPCALRCLAGQLPRRGPLPRRRGAAQRRGAPAPGLPRRPSGRRVPRACDLRRGHPPGGPERARWCTGALRRGAQRGSAQHLVAPLLPVAHPADACGGQGTGAPLGDALSALQGPRSTRPG
ncbi:serine/threonine-protein kinase [Archangium gephyra]|uniref:serine/threonine-protein kinase n=1 Tax=Archangium gephyra TaxID=48 RepID=UPI003B7A8C6C